MADITKKCYNFGDMCAVFATVDGITQFLLLPRGEENLLSDEKLQGISPLGAVIDLEPMLHIALSGDGYARDFSAGNTARYADTAFRLRLAEQKLNKEGEESILLSRFEDGRGLTVRNFLCFRQGTNCLTVWNEVESGGEEVTLEAMPSFNLSGIPHYENYIPEKTVLHKLISNWSGEGKLYSVTADRLALESSWSGLGIRAERWFQTGSMPARGQLPFAALEDTAHGTTWAVSMEAPASWVIETVFRNGSLSLGGGLGDFLTAHWRKILHTGEKFVTNRAFLTVVKGGLDDACDRLVKGCDGAIRPAEYDLPVLYNEYCYTWGKPGREQLLKMLPAAELLGCRYFVVDDGWFQKTDGEGRSLLGDWCVCGKAFPEGLASFSSEVRAHGMQLGVWYEFESVSVFSELFREHPELMLTYDGKIIRHRGRAFLDLRKEQTRELLREKVIRNLAENNIGYMKVDYNENIGLGADGAESYGEGLRAHMEGVISFFEEIKRTLPDLVLEICASGGMRHEPRFLQLADMVSFSDAHENDSGVNIACALHRFIPPRKLQIWATIREDYSLEDVRFTLAKAMLGRICFSGDIAGRPPEILAELERGAAFYRTLVPVLREGKTTVIEDEVTSYLRPCGRVYLIRESLDGKQKLLYAYALATPRAKFDVEIGNYRIAGAYNPPSDLAIGEGRLRFSAADHPRWGCVVRLERSC